MTSAMRAAVAVVVMSLLGACGPVAPGPVPAAKAVGVSQLPIIGGVLDTGDPAVVALAVKQGGLYEQYCTGTLVGPRTILTAAHCINAYGSGNAYYVVFAPDTTVSGLRAVRVASQVANPDYSSAGTGNDFGLVKLSMPVTDITPIVLNGADIQAWVGHNIRHAGYGVTNGPNQTGSGIKREVTYTLRQVTALELESGANGKQTCNGDSGGPAFMVPPGATAEVLVGVVSWGDQDCNIQGWDGRVDAVLTSWIKPTMDSWETPSCSAGNGCVAGCTPVDQDCVCVADGVCSPACLSPGNDPDCPKDCITNGICATQACGIPDADCKAVGTACDYVEQCFSRACISDPQHAQTYCSQTCAAKADCPSGMECTTTQCVFPQLPTRALGEDCQAGQDFCVASTCATSLEAGAVTRCVQACVSGADCPAGVACEAGRDGVRFCHPDTLVFVPTARAAAVTQAANGGQVATLSPRAGCSATGAASPTLPLLALAALALRRRGSR